MKRTQAKTSMRKREMSAQQNAMKAKSFPQRIITAKASAEENNKSNAKLAKGNDVISLILQDHKPLKKLIQTLKDEDVGFAEKKASFEQFAPLLTVHAKAEERSLYVHMKDEEELCMESYEGDTEHAIADQLVHEIKEVNHGEDEWMAKVKVLAELVEHHIEEEENEMFKKVRKNLDAEQRIEIGQEYLQLKEEVQEEENLVPPDRRKQDQNSEQTMRM